VLKKTIKYKDLDGNDVEDDFYFNLNKAEIAELELSRKGGLTAYFQALIDADEAGQVVAIFKEILERSIGKRSADGKQFIKNQEIRDSFFQSDAYSSLFMEFLENPTEEMGAAFMRGIVPADLVDTLPPLKPKGTTDVQLPNNEPNWLKEGRVPTAEEFAAATTEQKQKAFQMKTSQ